MLQYKNLTDIMPLNVAIKAYPLLMIVVPNFRFYIYQLCSLSFFFKYILKNKEIKTKMKIFVVLS